MKCKYLFKVVQNTEEDLLHLTRRMLQYRHCTRRYEGNLKASFDTNEKICHDYLGWAEKR